MCNTLRASHRHVYDVSRVRFPICARRTAALPRTLLHSSCEGPPGWVRSSSSAFSISFWTPDWKKSGFGTTKAPLARRWRTGVASRRTYSSRSVSPAKLHDMASPIVVRRRMCVTPASSSGHCDRAALRPAVIGRHAHTFGCECAGHSDFPRRGLVEVLRGLFCF